MANTTPDLIGLTLSNDRYTITEKLGEGGMGAVYRARDKNLQTDVVIKLPHPSMLTEVEFSRRFRDEVRSLVKLSHPHIVKVTDVGDWDGRPFAVLQFLPGGSLEDRLAAWRGPAALAALAGWLGPVASALDYVHSQNMVHRDVKPGNILFDTQGYAFLGDFGVVKVLAAAADDRSGTAAMTGTGMVLGTPHYMAPELIMGDPFDGRVDQYALAITAYELLSGRRPFEHETATRVLLMQAQDSPPSLTNLCPWVSPQLETALFKGLAKKSDDRYPTCTALAAAVIQATGVEKPGRARIRCGSCEQTMTVSVEALAKLSRAGRNAPCPKCKGILDLTAGTATVLPPSLPGEASRGGTSLLNIHGSTAEMPALKSRPEPAAAHDHATVVFGQISPNNVATNQESQELPSDDNHDHSSLPWIPIGIAALALVGGSALFWGMRSSQSEAPKTSLANQAAQPRVQAPTALDQLGASQQLTAEHREPGPYPSPAPVANEPSPSFPTRIANPGIVPNSAIMPNPAMSLNSTMPSSPGNPGQVTGLQPKSNSVNSDASDGNSGVSRANDSTVNPGQPTEPPSLSLAIIPDDQKPDQRNVPLKKLEANPDAYAGQLITLEQVYCIGTTPWSGPDGTLRVLIAEGRLEFKQGRWEPILGAQFEIGIDQQLAKQLIKLKRMRSIASEKPARIDWIPKVADVTIQVPESPNLRKQLGSQIVRLELCINIKSEFRKKTFVLIETEAVTQSGTTFGGKGDNDQWKRPNKLVNVFNQIDRSYQARVNRQFAAKRAVVDQIMDNAIQSSVAKAQSNQNALMQGAAKSMGPGQGQNILNPRIRVPR